VDGNHRLGTRVAALALVAALVGTATPQDAAPLVPVAVLEAVEKTAVDLARRGRRAECLELLDVAAELHAPTAPLAAAKEAAERALSKAKPAALPLRDLAASIGGLADAVAVALPSLEGAAKATVARQALRLDGANAPAHQALGDVRRGDAWVPAAVVPALERRAKIQAAVQAARRLDLELDIDEGFLPMLETVHGSKGFAVSREGISVQSASHAKERVARQFKQALRATALANWLVNGKLEVPTSESRVVVAFVATDEAYKRAVAEAVKNGDLTKDAAERALVINGFHGPGYSLHHATGETDIGSRLCYDLLYGVTNDGRSLYRAQPALVAGLLDWVCTNFLGVPMLRLAWTTGPERGATSDLPTDSPERREMLRLAQAGLAGQRLWMKWLAKRREDPAWSKAMLDEVGKIQGDPLLKTTLVCDYLFETEEFATLLGDTWTDKPGPEAFERAVGVPLAEFEERWRTWLFAGDPPAGLAQTLGASPVESASPQEKVCLDHLDKLRRQTLGKDAPAVGIDRESSDGCRAHALYLARHPTQLAKWPDAHEEYPDEQDFTPAGCRAGLSSVIVGPGIETPPEAVDGWMATFYHRLPLLAPGLVRIGWALEKGVAVLDAGSLVAPTERPTWVPWPPKSGAGMPRRFPGELPNPVPDADQSNWGYPVTLQFFGLAAEADVQMRLCVGAKRGAVDVPCHWSTPQKPTNAELAPAGAFCLIPKAPLAANTTYTVAVDGWPKDCAGADWSFTTGR
jgi:hypothetical protein